MVFDGGRTPGLRTQEMPLGNLIAGTMRTTAAQSDGGGDRQQRRHPAGFNAGDTTFEHALAVLPSAIPGGKLDLTGEELVAALIRVSQPGEGVPAGGLDADPIARGAVPSGVG